MSTKKPSFCLTAVDSSDIPEKIMEWFEERSRMFAQKYQPGNWLGFKKTVLSDGTIVWIGEQEKYYGEVAGTEHLHHILEVLDGNFVGYAEVRFNIDQSRPYFKGKPFVGFNDTTEQHRRSGRGLQRLHLMDQIARNAYGFPLASDTAISSAAAGVWRKLVSLGQAREFYEGESQRWQMIQD